MMTKHKKMFNIFISLEAPLILIEQKPWDIFSNPNNFME